MMTLTRVLQVTGMTLALLVGATALADIQVKKVSADLSKQEIDSSVWKGAVEQPVSLMAQPMAVPRPPKTSVPQLHVQAVHDGKWIAFRLRWKSTQRNEAGRLGEFSDAVALQFPARPGPPPAVFMGAKGSPVHIYHWRAQYQRDVERGKPEMQDLYPHMNPDMYPMEFKDSGSIQGLTQEKREVYSPAQALGNPQSHQKESAVDEILAEGFGTSASLASRSSHGKGSWNKGEWSVVMARPLASPAGSVIEAGKPGFVAFAVWEGSEQEAGARKSVTMSWMPLQVSP